MDPRITAGALMRKRGRMADRYVHLFLDERDEPLSGRDGTMYGRVVRTGQVDDELASAFGKRDNDLVIFR